MNFKWDNSLQKIFSKHSLVRYLKKTESIFSHTMNIKIECSKSRSQDQVENGFSEELCSFGSSLSSKFKLGRKFGWMTIGYFRKSSIAIQATLTKPLSNILLREI